MSSSEESFRELQAILIALRECPKTRRKFPKEVWNSVARLTESFSMEEVAQKLQLNPTYLKRKMMKFSPPSLDFQEITAKNPFDTVTIVLESSRGLKASIQGPIACLNSLQSLFGG